MTFTFGEDKENDTMKAISADRLRQSHSERAERWSKVRLQAVTPTHRLGATDTNGNSHVGSQNSDLHGIHSRSPNTEATKADSDFEELEDKDGQEQDNHESLK